jgi:hypothetical protein
LAFNSGEPKGRLAICKKLSTDYTYPNRHAICKNNAPRLPGKEAPASGDPAHGHLPISRRVRLVLETKTGDAVIQRHLIQGRQPPAFE